MLAVLKSNSSKAVDANEDVLTIEGLSKLTTLSKSTIYGLISEKSQTKSTNPLPFHKTGHKSLFFLKSEILDWIKRAK